MLYAGSATLLGLRFVVMDEVHYLADRARGAVWEEVIIHLPESVSIASLSATVSNAEEFGEWLRTVRGQGDAVHGRHAVNGGHDGRAGHVEDVDGAIAQVCDVQPTGRRVDHLIIEARTASRQRNITYEGEWELGGRVRGIGRARGQAGDETDRDRHPEVPFEGIAPLARSAAHRITRNHHSRPPHWQ